MKTPFGTLTEALVGSLAIVAVCSAVLLVLSAFIGG